MSAENKAVARRLLDAITRGNVDEAASCVADNYLYRGPAGELHGPDGFKQLVQTYLSAFPDLKLTIEDQIAEGDKVATRFLASGTHRGELAGVAASGRKVSVECITISRVVNGLIVEDVELFDQLGMFQTIGTLPAIAAAV
jgi:steroid delta-isomerase-like uncharacterized protein